MSNLTKGFSLINLFLNSNQVRRLKYLIPVILYIYLVEQIMRAVFHPTSIYTPRKHFVEKKSGTMLILYFVHVVLSFQTVIQSFEVKEFNL